MHDSGSQPASRKTPKSKRWLDWRVSVTSSLLIIVAAGIGRWGWQASTPTGPQVNKRLSQSAPPNRSSVTESAARIPTEPTAGGASETTSSPTTSEIDSTTRPTRYRELADDGSMLWAPPTTGNPLDFRYALQGSQAILDCRLEQVSRNSQAAQAITAVGGNLQTWMKRWESRNHVAFSDIDRLLISVRIRDDGTPEAAGALQLRDSAPLLKASNTPTPDEGSDSQWVFLGDSRDCMLRRATPSILVCGPPELVEEITAAVEPPVLRREFELLRQSTRDISFLTLIASPTFLNRDAAGLLNAEWGPLFPWLESTLPADARACMATVDLQDSDLFLELRCVLGQEDRNKATEHVGEILAKLPANLERNLQAAATASALGKDSKALAERIVAWVQFVEQQRRWGLEGRQLIVNWSLPARAAPRMVLALRTGLVDSSTNAGVDGPREKGPNSMEEILRESFSFRVPQQSLEGALRDLTTVVNDKFHPSIPFAIKIDGPHLEAQGITRNQQVVGLDVSLQPIAQVLTEIVLRANPVHGEHAAHDPAQKLVWLIRRLAPEDGIGQPLTVVWITTRQAASQNGWKLPPIFEIP